MQPFPTSFEEAIAVASGEDLESHRERRDFDSALYEKVEDLEDLQPEAWPKLLFNWDISRECQRHSLDGTTTNDFQSAYPDGFLAGWVLLADFDKKLCHFSRRDMPEELWEVGSKRKLSRMIRYLSRGLPVSPPLVKPLDSGEVILQGGHHRYTAAKFAGETELPIHTEPQYKDRISALFTIRWVEA